MTVIVLPAGLPVDFEDASQEEIEDALEIMRNEDPSLFEEKESAPFFGEYPATSVDEIFARSERAAQDPSVQVPEFKPDHEGEVRDAGFQFLYGRADDISEKAKRIEDVFGPDSYQQIEGTDKFVLKLENISPELKKQYGLPDSGTIYVNKPGFSWYDLAGFGGAEAAPMTAALGAGLVFSGVGLIPGMLLMAGAGFGGKAFDEFIIEDRLEKMNTQSDDQVWGDAAMTGIFYGLGEMVGRGLWAAGRRIFKGPGPRPDPSRIAALVKGGMGRAAATKIAREESKTELRRAIAGDKELGITGARPTVSEVSQKAIMGRIQSIYEGIFPNAQAAARNLEFVQTTLARLGAGEINEAAAKSELSRHVKSINATVANAMKNADVDETVRLANQHLVKVIDNEFKVLLDLYNPKAALDVGWQSSAQMAARLFDQDSSILYKKSEDILKSVLDANGEPISLTFSPQILKKLVDDLAGPDLDATKAVAGDAFNHGLFKYILNKDSFSLTELTSLKSALRSVTDDPALMPGLTDSHIGRFINKIDETIEGRLAELAELRVVGKSTNDAVSDAFEEGLTAYFKAKAFHAKGIERFRGFAHEILEKNIRNGTLLGPREVLETIVQPGNPTKLLSYLKSVTPSGRAATDIQKVPRSVFDRAATAAREGRFKVANEILDEARVSEEIVKRLPAFADDLPRGPAGQLDDYARMVGAEFSDRIRSLGRMAEARANPLAFRNEMRDALAREWLVQRQTSSVVRGEFSPTVFASHFDQLGTGLQNALFGKTNATAMRQLMKDYHKVGASNKQFAHATAEALGATASTIRAKARGLTGGRSVSDEIAHVQTIMKEAERQSEDALFQAIARGKIDDADSLVLNVLKNPNNYNRLVNRFGRNSEPLDGALGLKDMVMSRIMEAAFPEGIIPERISSGAWGAPMRRQLTELNRNGALAKILGDGDAKAGQPIVDDLFKASKIGERISDTALKGKQGLASAAFAAGAGMRLMTNPLSFIGEAVGIFTMGRIMRQKWFLNSLLQPRYSAGVGFGLGGRRLLQAGRRAGADLEGVSPLGLEVRERVAQEARLVAAAMGEGQVGTDTREEVTETVRENIIDPLRNMRGEVTETVRENIVRPPQGLQLPTAQPPQGAQIRPPVSPLRQAADPRYQAMQDVLGNP